MDWRSDKDLLHEIMMNAKFPGQMLYQNDRNAALKEDREKKRGHLILNPDLDTGTFDVEGMVIGRPGVEHEGKEYRVVFDQNLKGMTDPETGEMRAGFWVEHFPLLNALTPIIPLFDITGDIHHPTVMYRPAPAPMEYPQMSLFDLEEDEDMPAGEVHVKQDGEVKGTIFNIAQQGIIGIAASEYPEWYAPSKDRKEANMRVLQGRHPMGHALGDPATSCGDCAYLIGRAFSKTYWKCAKSKRTGGPATDIRKKWRGCEHWMDGPDVMTNPDPELFIHGPNDLKRKLICDLGPDLRSAIHRLSPEAIMASPEKADLVAAIEDAMHNRCYKAWLTYYQRAELVDRGYPHAPARQGSKEVQVQGIGKPPDYHKALRQLKKERDAAIGEAKPDILKQAQSAADMDFSKNLEHCDCSDCKGARHGR